MKKYFEDRIADIATNNISKIPLDYFIKNYLKYYPAKVYKYRACNNNNFKALKQDYLWASLPSNFDDSFDSIINLKLATELPEIRSWILKHSCEVIYYTFPPKGMQPRKRGTTLKKMLEIQDKLVDSQNRITASRIKKLTYLETNRLKKAEKYEVNRIINYLESPEYEDYLYNKLDGIVESLRKTNKVCCVTLTHKNRKMWEDYANKSKGFCIEYDLSRIKNHPECLSSLLHLFPVQYYKRMPKVPLLPYIEYEFNKMIYGKEIDITSTNTKVIKQIFAKHKDYEQENEWRFVSPINEIYLPFVSSVYAGYDISEKNLEKLKIICKNKGVKLYKQERNIAKSEMVYKEINLT